MKKMFSFLNGYKVMIFLLVISVIGSVITNLALPAYLSAIINRFIPNGDVAGIIQIGGSMLIFVIIGAISSIATGYFASVISTGHGRLVRSQVFKKIQYFSQTEFDQFSTSSLITRTNNDITQVQTFINMFLRVCLMAPFMCIGGIVMALAKSKTMSMILVVSMPVMFLFVIIIGKYSIPLSKKMQEKVDEINLVIREKLTGLRVARAFGTEEYESERFDRVNTDFMNNTINMNTLMGVMIPGLNLILYATTVALIYFGGHQIANTTSGIPIGDVIAVIQYVMQIMMSVMMLSMIFVMYPRASTSATRINEVLDTELAIKSKKNAIVESDKKGYLKFQNVSFTFPKAASPALENISFESKPGEVTAIIGSTGSGKSTLINLIPRLRL